jgi:hypothetical protein
MSVLTGRRTSIVSGAAVLATAAVVVGFSVNSPVYPVHHADLNDGGVWVTNNAAGLFGRLNAPVDQLDGGFYPQDGSPDSYQLDVVQDGASVVGWDKGGGLLLPVDVTTMTAPKSAAAHIAATSQVSLAGGSLAVLDPARGRLWATRLNTGTPLPSLADVDSAARELATAGGHAALAVGPDGTVYAASADTRTLTTLRPSGTGFTAPLRAPIAVSGAAVQVTAVGAEPVVLDPAAGEVTLPSGRTTDLPPEKVGDPRKIRLQQPGPAADSVVLATTTGLLTVPLAGGTPSPLISGVSGEPIAPVRLGNCVHGAWYAQPTSYDRACGGTAAPPQPVQDHGSSEDSLVFRVNRGQIRLNDEQTGAVWTVDDKVRQVADWSAIKPPPTKLGKDKNRRATSAEQARTRPPKANNDDLGARPGRTTVLHVLDNDSYPAGSMPAVVAFTHPDAAGATLQPAADGQTIAITLPARTTDDVRFGYTLDDGRGRTATAQVTVHPHAADVNSPPTLRPGFRAQAWPDAASAQVTIPVTADWRDRDGDPVLLTKAGVLPGHGSAGTTPDGRVIYNAPPVGGPQQIAYAVSDGAGGQTQGTLQVLVQDPKSSAVLPPKAEPDAIFGIVGRPVTLHPLDNDEPGADPTSDDPRLELGSKLTPPGNLHVQTDLDTGAVTITGLRPGTTTLPYPVTYGAGSARGVIRVTIESAPDRPKPPVTAPDTAVLHGQQPAIIDVLANDYDPAGAVLAVQHAAPADGATAGLRVAIIDSRWLRIDATSAGTDQNSRLPRLIRYTVSDGSGSATGEVSVTQLPQAATNSAPITQDDRADVRAGDVVTMPVLDNDLDPDGDLLTLAPRGLEVSGTPRQGAGYVAGNQVRYAAPAGLGTLTPVVLTYTAQDPAGATATGRLRLTVHPASEANLPPAPLPITASVVGGDTVTIRPQVTGIDPNGDSVTVTGIAAAPKLGRILTSGPVSLSYQAFPTSTGTDEFSYQVMDRFGATGIATVRIGVQPPADPQPPVAVDDVLTARPGATVAVAVAANDLIAPGDEAASTVRLIGAPVGAAAHGTLVTVPAPAADGNPVVVPYRLGDGLSESRATLTVRGLAGFDNPPVARDDDAVPAGPTARTATVDVLGNDDDPDGPRSALRISAVAAGGTVNGRRVTVALQPRPQNVWYEVRDGQGGTALGVIHAPAAGTGLPYVKSGALIRVDRGRSATIGIGQYVVDPAGRPVRLTLARNIWAAPAGMQARSVGDTHLTLTGRAGYVGPAAVTFEVTDGASLTDPAGQRAVLTIPVQVGPDTPVLRCPTSTITLVEGGPAIDVPLRSVCHVWLPTSMPPGELRFSARWTSQPTGVTAQVTGHTLRLQAGGAAQPGSSGITIGVAGSTQRQQLTVQVIKPPPPTVQPIDVAGVRAEQARTVDIAPYVSSPIQDSTAIVLSATRLAGPDATISAAGSTVTVRPVADARGDIVFGLAITDVPGRADRQIHGQLTVHVLGHPATLAAPTADANRSLGHQVQVSWPVPGYDGGAPIDQYRVSWAGGSHLCAASGCAVPGLANGTAYRFTVAAHNIAGFWSLAESPPSNAATPDSKPGPVTGLAVGQPVGNRSLALSWATNRPDGSPVDQYQVEIADVGSTSPGTRTTTVPGGATRYAATGLVNNDPYRFRIRAHNADGWGPYGGAVPGQAAGVPAALPAPTVPAEQSTSPADNTVAVVNWQPATDPNGPPVRYYSVYRKISGSFTRLPGCAQVSAGGALSCTDTVQNSGATYYYAVTVTNGAGIESKPVNGQPFIATGIPDQVGAVSAAASGNPGPGPQTDSGPSFGDGTVHVTFTVPDPHGARITRVEYSLNGSGGADGSWSSPGGAGQQVTEPITGLSNGNGYSIAVRGCNEGNGGGENCGQWSPAADPVYPYGPPPTPTVAASNGGTVVTYSWGGGANGRPVHFWVSIDGGGFADRGTAGGSEQDDRGYNHAYSLRVHVIDSAGQQSPDAAAGGTTPAPPQPTITASQGAPGWSSIGTCTSSSSGCNWLSFQVHNFPTGRYTWQCISNGTVSYQSTATVNVTDPNQSFSGGSGANNGYCVFGRGYSEQIRFANVTSNSVPHNP